MSDAFAPPMQPGRGAAGRAIGPGSGALARNRIGMGAGLADPSLFGSAGNGVGSRNYMTDALSPSMPQPSGAVPGVDPAWSRIFGASTPGGLLAQRTANGGVTPPPGATTAQPAAPAAPSPAATPTPQSAGSVNGSTPGAFNGNQENGFSSEKQAGGQSNEQQGGPPTTPNYMTDVLQRAAPPPAVPGMEKMPNVVAGGSTVPGITPPAPAVQSSPAAAAQAAPPMATAAGESASTTREAAAPGANAGVPTKSAPADNQQVTYGGKTVMLDHSASQASFNRMSPQQQAGYVRAHYVPTLADARIDVDQTTFQVPQNIANYPLPIRNDITKAINDAHTIYSLRSAPGSVGDPAKNRLVAKTQASLDAAVAALKKRGITLNTNGTPGQGQGDTGGVDNTQGPPDSTQHGHDAGGGAGNGAATGGTDTGSGNGSGSTGTGGGSGGTGADPTPWTGTVPGGLDDHSGGTGTQAGGGTGTQGATTPAAPDPNDAVAISALRLTNTLTGNATADFDTIMKEATRLSGGDFTKKTQIFDLLNGYIDKLNARGDHQTGINLMGNAASTAQTDPMRAKAQGIVGNILDHPDPTNEQTLRNKFISNQDKLGEQIVQNLSAGAGRRGLSTGAVTGMQSRALGENANATATGLGDLSVAADARLRAGQEDALRQESANYQQYQMGDWTMADNLARFYANPNGQATPLPSLLDSTLGIRAVDQAQAASHPSTYANILAGVGAVGGIVGGIAKL